MSCLMTCSIGDGLSISSIDVILLLEREINEHHQTVL
jgi:hypothetical protein